MYYGREIKPLWSECLCERAKGYLIKERLPDCLFCDSAKFSCNSLSVRGCVVYLFKILLLWGRILTEREARVVMIKRSLSG